MYYIFFPNHIASTFNGIFLSTEIHILLEYLDLKCSLEQK